MSDLIQSDLFVGDQDDVNELYRQVFQYRNGRKFKEMAGAGETCGRMSHGPYKSHEVVSRVV